ncbi:unnamed protein product [marine sediment metagenome]|uniref:Uncharacterized protein n=1 Tax=marine sediment metagenome TaxID=412755 RepID=X1DBE4_9ZZZZ
MDMRSALFEAKLDVATLDETRLDEARLDMDIGDGREYPSLERGSLPQILTSLGSEPTLRLIGSDPGSVVDRARSAVRSTRMVKLV